MRIHTALVLAAGIVTSAPAAAEESTTRVSLKAPDGADMGSAHLREGPSGVLMRLEMKGLTPGWHGIHLHETGACSDDKFQSAGSHINHAPDKKPHGLLNPDGPDFGDLPNVHADEDGVVNAEVFTSLVSLDGAGGRPALRDENGSALVVHAKVDDHASQPIGGAGDRVACGVIGK